MSISDKYKYSELTSKIIGCAMQVQQHLGNGFQQVVYQRALAVEFSLQGMAFKREFEMPLEFKRVMNKNQSSGLLAGVQLREIRSIHLDMNSD